MRISDWSSDVCSSDLHALHRDALASALAAQTVAGADAAAHDDSMAMSPGAVPLPPQSLRGRVGAPDVGNFLYVCDQWAQVLSHYIGGQGESTLLDIGCGCGRPARALLNDPRVTAYLGLDADPTLVHWCNAGLRPASGRRFLSGWIGVYSETYHRHGSTPDRKSAV